MTTPDRVAGVDVSMPERINRFIFPFITLSLLIAAVGAIDKLLDDISFMQIVEELQKLSYEQIGCAVLFTVASYWLLSGYDWMALRYLGRSLPYFTVVLATFCSCAISYTVGANLLSGGSVRYRIYVSAGLSASDVVRITLFGMIAFSVGTTVVAAMALSFQPEVITECIGVPSITLRYIGLATLGLCSVFLAVTFLRRSPIRFGPWRYRLPSPGISVLQLVVSVADMIFAGGCLYILISEPNLPFIGFLIVYSLSFVAGLISHVPGGLGVFDGILLFAFQGAVMAESLAASLLVYRVIYYLVPLIMAAAILGIRELMERSANMGARAEN